MTSVSPMVAGWPHSVPAPVLAVHAGNPISAVAATGRTTQAEFANCTTANALPVLGSGNRNMLGLAGTMFRFTDPKTGNAFAVVQFANSAWVVLPVAATGPNGFPAIHAGYVEL